MFMFFYIYLPINYFISIIIACLCMDAIKEKGEVVFTKIVSSFIVVSVVSFALYAIMTRVIQSHYHVSSDSYFTGMIGWIHQAPKDTLKNTIGFIATYFTFHAPYGLNIFFF